MPQIITISGDIGWEVRPADITKQLNDAAGQDIDVNIASPGGFVFDGIEIFNAFRDYKRKYPSAQMSATIKGLAASMASYLAVNPVFDLIAAEDNAVFMIHNPFGGVAGDYRDMEKMAEILTGITDLLSQQYIKKTGKSAKAIRQMMDEESWFFGSEIKDAGFVDEIVPTQEGGEKSASVASAKLKFQNLTAKLSDTKIDIEKAAAYIKPSTPAPNPASKMRETIKQEDSMNLEELLKQNPAAKSEYDAALKAEKEAGIAEGKKAMTEISARAAVFAANKEYPAQIHAVALEVMQGKKGIEALETLVANADLINQMVKSAQAQAEQPAVTPGQQPTPLTDVMSQIKRDRVALGLEV